jgi:hypothetical protein
VKFVSHFEIEFSKELSSLIFEKFSKLKNSFEGKKLFSLYFLLEDENIN